MQALRSLLLVLLIFQLSTTTTTTAKPLKPHQDLIHTSCIHASYPDICVQTLSTYSGPASTPRDLAQAAVKISLSRARKVSNYLKTTLKSSQGGVVKSKKERAALIDCVEQISDSVDELTSTLSELKKLNLIRGEEWKWRMSNAETWVSAALTNEDTCLDGFVELEVKVRSDVKKKITNVAKVTSNALYLITRLDNKWSRGKGRDS